VSEERGFFFRVTKYSRSETITYTLYISKTQQSSTQTVHETQHTFTGHYVVHL